MARDTMVDMEKFLHRALMVDVIAVALACMSTALWTIPSIIPVALWGIGFLALCGLVAMSIGPAIDAVVEQMKEMVDGHVSVTGRGGRP